MLYCKLKKYYTMNKFPITKITFMTVFLFYAAMMTSCGDEGKDSERVAIVTVASTLEEGAPLPPATPENPTIVYFMKVTEEGSQKTDLICVGRIEGFEFEEGYEYKLKVLITKLSTPPADGHSETYQLLEILSKNKKEI